MRKHIELRRPVRGEVNKIVSEPQAAIAQANEVDMIVLLTDFGDSEYVGVMKGVIYRYSTDAKIVDLCHTIQPQCIIEASWILKNNYKYFPKGAIFCCVVDPGVGTKRKALAIKTKDYYFVGPDNGLMWEALAEQKIIEVRQITVTADASRTFHGRDIFAKAAAQIENGNFESIGKKIKTIKKLELYKKGRYGIVVRIDRFGNIITNLARQKKTTYCVKTTSGKYKVNLHMTYESAKKGELFLIEGSNNTLEISLKNGNANDHLCMKPGEKIKIS
jgi:S-adenosylmethionine hydrolase